MWKLFRSKRKELLKFYIKFYITYKQGNGKTKYSEPIFVIISAVSKEKAEQILYAMAVNRMDIKISECIEKNN